MEKTEYTRRELLIARKKCDASLLFFTRFFFKALRGTKFIVSDHHETICDELKKIEHYELELLNINIPPRFSKTELGAVNMIARGIGMNPTSNWLYITASDELRAQTSVSVRDIVTHPYFKVMYGTELKRDQNGKNLWRTEQGGGLKTATIFGQITGFGAGQMIDHTGELMDYVRTFEGCIILDDINKIDDSGQMNANNEKVSRVLFNTIFSRKNSSDTPMINIQQRAGMTDATAQLMDHYGETEKAKFLVMPVIDSNGVPLWEWKHNVEDIEKLKTSPKTAHTFETQYMQNPQPQEGLLFPIGELKRFDENLINHDEAIGKLAFVDIADEGEDNHSVPIGEIHEGKILITDALFTKEGSDLNVGMTADILNKHKPEYCRIESNFGGSMYVGLLTPKVSSSVNLLPIRAKGQKHARINQLAGFIKDYCYFKKDYDPKSDYGKFMENLTMYTKNGKGVKHDDAPDSLHGLCYMARSFHPDLWDGFDDVI